MRGSNEGETMKKKIKSSNCERLEPRREDKP